MTKIEKRESYYDFMQKISEAVAVLTVVDQAAECETGIQEDIGTTVRVVRRSLSDLLEDMRDCDKGFMNDSDD